MKQIQVAAAIIHDNQGRIFATQRGYGDWKDYWEFPGGKLPKCNTPHGAKIKAGAFDAERFKCPNNS